MAKKSFLIYIDSLDILEELSDEEAGRLFKAIKSAQKGEDLQLDSLIRIAFAPFKAQFARDLEKYETICERNRSNGLKGGRPKSEANPENPVGSLGGEANPKNHDSDSDSDSDSDNKDTRGATAPKQEPLFSTKSDIKPSLVKELYNDMFSELASWKAKNASRETRLRNFIKSRQADVGEFNMADLETYFICIKNECQWMLERQNGYKAKNIDFFLSEKCWAGVFEGSYRRDQ